MKLKFRKRASQKTIARAKNKVRIRRKVKGDAERPRLCIYRSGRHIYAQVVDDDKGITLAAASTLKSGLGSNRDAAKKIGTDIAKMALGKNIKRVVFDRSGYVYHGRIQALAEGAREGGLNF